MANNKFRGKKPPGVGKKKFNKSKPISDAKAKLIVRNLSFKTSEDTLKNHFETYGKINNVTLLKRPNGDLVGCGFVQFEDVDSAKQALEQTNMKSFLGRSIQVDWAVSKDEFVKKIPKNVERENNPKIQKKYQQTASGTEKEVKSEAITKTSKKARLVVRNISFKATEESLKSHFSTYGKVLESVLLKKPNGELIGCGFIQMESVQDAAKAIHKANGLKFLGRAIHVDWAVAKNKYMSYVVQKKDEEELLKADVKSEPESDNDESQDIKTEIDKNSSYSSVKQDPDEDDDKSADSDVDSVSGDSSQHDDVDDQTIDKRVSANDAEDGKTVFLKNVPFSVTNEDLEEFIKPFGEFHYALVCVDKLKEHSKGTAFVRFKNKEDADIFLSSESEKKTIEGQLIEALPAILRDNIAKKNNLKKQAKDARNLYLIKEGVILANSKAAQGVSASDISKRLSLEQKKTQMLRNLNRFISRYRLTIHNIPPHYTDQDLKELCLKMANAKVHCLKECRVMRHLKGPVSSNGKLMSKGYGFVMFTRHEDALTCLRRLNNHPSVFDKNNRPIVSFSIEDRAVLNARKKRLEKSQLKNPYSKLYVPPDQSLDNKNTHNEENSGNTKEKKNKTSFTARQVKKIKTKGNQKQKDSFSEAEKNSRESYTGEMSKPGSTRMRSKFKLRNEAIAHKENLKKERRKNRRAKTMEAIKTRNPKKIKLQKKSDQKKPVSNTKKLTNTKEFSQLVNKYKSKLTSGKLPEKVKSKWFE